MEQRPLRLGDIVDDYCPRERRLTNHVVVAIVDDAIRQTRCTTCDAEHPYKEGKEPVRRRKALTSADEGGRGQLVASVPPGPAAPDDVLREVVGSADDPDDAAPATAGEGTGDPAADVPPPTESPDGTDDGWGWPAHRQLIRATLPRIEGEPPAPRPIPEFTMHQRPAGRRGQGYRFVADQGRNGNTSGRADGNRTVNGNVQPNGNRAGRGRSGRRRGHQKRSR